MVKIIPYLLVPNGKAALQHYQTIFAAKLITHQKFTPEIGKSMNFPKDFDYENSTMHAVLEIAGEKIYLADNNQETQDYGHVEITLELDTETQIQSFYQNSIDNGCKEKLALAQHPWGWYARILDKFGVGWQLNYIPSEED